MSTIKLTSYNAAAALGVSRYKTQADLVRQMVRESHGMLPERDSAFVSDYIKNNYIHAFSEYCSTAAYMPDTSSEKMQINRPGAAWLVAMPSGIIRETNATLEIRLPLSMRNKSREEVKFLPAKEIPDFYARIQIGMYCTGASRCHAYQWAPQGDLLELIDIDHQWLDSNIPRLRLFYQQVLNDRFNEEHLKPKFQSIETDEARRLIAEYETTIALIEDATARKEEILEELIEIAGENNSIIAGKKLQKIVRSGSVQYARIVKDKLPDLSLADYTGKPTEYWTLK